MTFIKPLGYDPKKCRELIEKNSLSGIVVSSNENVFYSTGLPVTRGQANPILFALSNKFPPFAVIDSEGLPTPVVWAGAIGNHELWAKDARTSFFPGGTTEELLTLVQERFSSNSKIGVESSIPYYLGKKVLETTGASELIPVDNIFEDLRIIKSEEEIHKLQKSLNIAEGAVKKVRDELEPTTTVMELVQKSKRLIFELGGSGVDHATISVGKSNPEILEDLKASSGDLIVLDIGAILDGYVSDTRRIAFVGDIPEDLRKLNSTMARVVTETGESLTPGKSFGQVCLEVEERYRKNGLPPLFLHAGHTIGIQTEEIWITRDSERKIEPNMVFNIELYSAFEMGRYVGSEDTFVVRDSSGEQMSHLSHDIGETK